MDDGRFFGTELFGFCKADVLHYIEISTSEYEKEKEALKKEKSELAAKLKEADNTIAIVSAQYDNQMSIINSKELIIRDLTKNLAICKQKIRQLTLNNPLNNAVTLNNSMEYSSTERDNGQMYAEKLEKEAEALRSQLNSYTNNVKTAMEPFIKNAIFHAENAATAVEGLKKEIHLFKEKSGIVFPSNPGVNNTNIPVNNRTSSQSAENPSISIRRQEPTRPQQAIAKPNPQMRNAPHRDPRQESYLPPYPSLWDDNKTNADPTENDFLLGRAGKQPSANSSIPDASLNNLRDTDTILDDSYNNMPLDFEGMEAPAKDLSKYPYTPLQYNADSVNSLPKISIPRTVDPTIDGKDIQAFLNMDIDSILNPAENENL